MTVSTDSSSSCRPRSACIMRRLPSKANGRVTTATVRAPISLASEAITGAAPVPVPPPRPAVTKTMSAPSSASMILSESSSAARRPTSGFAPAPRPLVSLTPSWSFTAAFELWSACTSVFAAMNSTPSTWAAIMRFTALFPPPPTPMTLMRAWRGMDSSYWIRRSFGFMSDIGVGDSWSDSIDAKSCSVRGVNSPINRRQATPCFSTGGISVGSFAPILHHKSYARGVAGVVSLHYGIAQGQETRFHNENGPGGAAIGD